MKHFFLLLCFPFALFAQQSPVNRYPLIRQELAKKYAQVSPFYTGGKVIVPQVSILKIAQFGRQILQVILTEILTSLLSLVQIPFTQNQILDLYALAICVGIVDSAGNELLAPCINDFYQNS